MIRGLALLLLLAELGLAHDPVFLGIDHAETDEERVALAQHVDPLQRKRNQARLNRRGRGVVRLSESRHHLGRQVELFKSGYRSDGGGACFICQSGWKFQNATWIGS